MIRTQVQLTEEQAAALRAMAARANVSVAALIRQGVAQLVGQGGSGGGEQRRARALQVVGRFASGRKDVSERHDEHLAEALGS
jgi:hypothetical protein